MDLKQLQYFLAVAEQLNFSKAAEMLYVTQPLLSQRVAELEKELGVVLFNRNRRSVQLTPAGAILADKARNVLDEVSSIGTVVQRTANGLGLECDLNIGYEEVFERTLLTQALFRFQCNYPSYHGHLSCYTLGQITKALHDGELELAFTMMPNPKMPPDYEVHPVAYDCLAMVASSHLAPRGCTLERMLLLMESLPLYMMDNDRRGMTSILSICSVSLKVMPRPLFFTDMSSILLNVEAGCGVTILPHRVVRTYASPYLTICPLAHIKEAQLTLAACWDQKKANPAIPSFLSCLAATVSNEAHTNAAHPEKRSVGT